MIHETALLVRTRLEAFRACGEVPIAALEEFPHGGCKTASWIYLYYLQKYHGIDPNILYLVANAQITESESHAWARVGRFYVDITGDQFGADKVVVCDSPLWPDIYVAPNEYPLAELRFEGFHEGYGDKFARVCRFIDRGW